MILEQTLCIYSKTFGAGFGNNIVVGNNRTFALARRNVKSAVRISVHTATFAVLCGVKILHLFGVKNL